MASDARWVVDTSCYTHLCRSGHAALLERLAPGRLVVVPWDVNEEIEEGRERYPSIPAVSSVPWAELTMLTEDEEWTQLQVKAALGGGPEQHRGECAVIACAYHRGHVAIVDERAAVEQAHLRGVPTHDTLWIVIEAYKALFGRDRAITARVVDDLIATGMWLPVDSGESLLAWGVGLVKSSV